VGSGTRDGITLLDTHDSPPSEKRTNMQAQAQAETEVEAEAGRGWQAEKQSAGERESEQGSKGERKEAPKVEAMLIAKMDVCTFCRATSGEPSNTAPALRQGVS
jgi:hypothetical protein